MVYYEPLTLQPQTKTIGLTKNGTIIIILPTG